MQGFNEVIHKIYRLKIPFDTVYTSVFLIEQNQKYILVDCASTAYDVTNYIVPALRALGISSEQIQYLVVTHQHEDHAGGLQELLRQYPNVEVVTSVKELSSEITTYPLPGHTEDCIGVLDLRSKTMISGDGIQGYGVDKYRCSTHNEAKYMQTLEKIRMDERIENVLFSHAYEPWNKDHAFGRSEVENCLQDSLAHIEERRRLG